MIDRDEQNEIRAAVRSGQAKIRALLRTGKWGVWADDAEAIRQAYLTELRLCIKHLQGIERDVADDAKFAEGRKRHAADAAKKQAAREARRPAAASPSANRSLAFTVLDLPVNAGQADIAERASNLIKKFHPDANAGDRSNEDRLRAVIAARDALLG